MTIQCPRCMSANKAPTEKDFTWKCLDCGYVYHVRECPRTWEEIYDEIEERTGRHPQKHYCENCGVEISERQYMQFTWCDDCLQNEDDDEVD